MDHKRRKLKENEGSFGLKQLSQSSDLSHSVIEIDDDNDGKLSREVPGLTKSRSGNTTPLASQKSSQKKEARTSDYTAKTQHLTVDIEKLDVEKKTSPAKKLPNVIEETSFDIMDESEQLSSSSLDVRDTRDNDVVVISPLSSPLRTESKHTREVKSTSATVIVSTPSSVASGGLRLGHGTDIHNAPVRKKAERELLKGHECPDCKKVRNGCAQILLLLFLFVYLFIFIYFVITKIIVDFHCFFIFTQ